MLIKLILKLAVQKNRPEREHFGGWGKRPVPFLACQPSCYLPDVWAVVEATIPEMRVKSLFFINGALRFEWFRAAFLRAVSGLEES